MSATPAAPAASPATPAATPAAAPAPSPAAAATPAAAAAPAAPAAPAPATPAPAAPAAAAPASPDAAAVAAAKAAEDAAKGAPEKYEAFTAPEGTTLDQGTVTAFEDAARKLNLSQTKAQELLNEMSPVIAKQQNDRITATLTKADADWLAASKADPEFGGDAFDANAATAKRAVDTFGTPALKDFLNSTRLGNHPEWVRFSYRIGKALSQDGKVVTGSVSGDGKTLESRLWPNQTNP